MIIDCHAHILSQDYLARLERLPEIVVTRTGKGKAYAFAGDPGSAIYMADEWLGVERIVRDCDARGIDLRLISLVLPEAYCFPAEMQAGISRRANDEIVAAVRAHPDRLRGVASLPLGDPAAAVAELDRVAAIEEMVAVQVGSSIAGVSVADARYEPVWARIDALRMPVIEHPVLPAFSAALSGPLMAIRLGFMFDTELMLAQMLDAGLFARYPNFPFVVAHTGAGLLSVAARLDRTARNHPALSAAAPEPPTYYLKRLYYDTCSFSPPAIRMAREMVGPGRLLFGTDYPFVPVGPDHLDGLDFDAAEMEDIKSGTAAALFGIG